MDAVTALHSDASGSPPDVGLRQDARPARRGSDPSEWLDRHGDVLFAYAARRVDDRTLAEDLVQDTLLAAIESRGQFAGRASERTWLVGILKHKLIDHRRRAASRQLTNNVLEALVESRFDRRGVWRDKPRAWPAGEASDEQLEILRRCLGRLPAGMAEVLQLYERSEVTADAVGAVLGLSATGVWSRLYRARTALRECLDRNWFQRETGP